MTTPWENYPLTATSKDPQAMRDLDETRRLLYSALYASRTKHHEIAGTIVNALAHHGAGIPADISEGYVLALVNGEGVGGSGSAAQVYPMARDWARLQIERITELLGG